MTPQLIPLSRAFKAVMKCPGKLTIYKIVKLFDRCQGIFKYQSHFDLI